MKTKRKIGKIFLPCNRLWSGACDDLSSGVDGYELF